MRRLLAKVILSAAIASSGAIAVYAAQPAAVIGQHIRAGASPQPVRVGGGSYEVAASKSMGGRSSSNNAATFPGLTQDGLCCATDGPVIPLGTPMREPIVPTAPGMPGQPAPIGTTSTLPAGQ